MKDKLHISIQDKSYPAQVEGKFLVLDEAIPFGPYEGIKRIPIEKHPLDTAGEVVNKTIKYLRSVDGASIVGSDEGEGEVGSEN